MYRLPPATDPLLAQLLVYSERSIEHIAVGARLGMLDEIADTFDLSMSVLEERRGGSLSMVMCRRPEEKHYTSSSLRFLPN